MTNHMLMKTFFIPCDLSLLREATEFGLQVSPQGLGYEIEAAELARELRLHTPGTSVGHALPEVEADEFETIFHWFLS